MAIVYYNNAADIGTELAGTFAVMRCHDITLTGTQSNEFDAQIVQLADGTTGHVGYLTRLQIDPTAIVGYTPAAIVDSYGKTFYFASDINFKMPGRIISINDIWYADISAGFARVERTSTSAVIQSGSNGEQFNVEDFGNNTNGIIALEANVIANGVSYPCYAFMWVIADRDGGEPPYVYAGIVLTKNILSSSITDPQGGIPQEPEGGNGDYLLPSETLDLGSAAALSSDMGGGGIASPTARGTHLYEIDLAAMADFTNAIYGSTGGDGFSFADIWQQYKNQQHDPLSGVIGSLILPISPTSTDIGYIRLSGQSFSVGGVCKAVSDRFYDTGDIQITINPYYKTYLDYAPYTNISLYLPFIGAVSVNTNECMGGMIQINYRVDCCTGDCVAYVVCTDRDGHKAYYNYSGNCAAYIPISSYDAGISSLISGAAGVIGGLATGNAAGVFAGAAQMIEPRTTQKHVGGFSGGSGYMGVLYPFVVINRPSSAIPEGFTSRIGGVSAMSGAVGDYSGYTQFEYVNLSSVSGATDAVKSEIIAQLQKGVIIV